MNLYELILNAVKKDTTNVQLLFLEKNITACVTAYSYDKFKGGYIGSINATTEFSREIKEAELLSKESILDYLQRFGGVETFRLGIEDEFRLNLYYSQCFKLTADMSTMIKRENIEKLKEVLDYLEIRHSEKESIFSIDSEEMPIDFEKQARGYILTRTKFGSAKIYSANNNNRDKTSSNLSITEKIKDRYKRIIEVSNQKLRKIWRDGAGEEEVLSLEKFLQEQGISLDSLATVQKNSCKIAD